MILTLAIAVNLNTFVSNAAEGANTRRKLVTSPVAVGKVAFPSKQPKLGDRKCLGEPRKSFTVS